MSNFQDYCKDCKKEVTITAHELGTVSATCENGHTWWEGKKYKAKYYEATTIKNAFEDERHEDVIALLKSRGITKTNILGGIFQIEPI